VTAPPADGRGAPGPDLDAWHRLHPATPLLRGGLGLVVVLGIVWSNFRDDFVNTMTGANRASDQPDTVAQLRWLFAGPYALAVIAGLAVLILGLLGLLWLSWRMSAYRYTDQMVELRRGVVFRSHRSTRLDRVQRVDIDRPLLARILGLSRVRIGTAHSSGGLDIAYLSRDRALQVRDDLLRLVRAAQTAEAVPAYLVGPGGVRARAGAGRAESGGRVRIGAGAGAGGVAGRPDAVVSAGVPAGGAPAGDAAAVETSLLRQPNWRVAVGMLCSVTGVVLAGLIVLLVVGIIARRPILVASVAPPLLAVGYSRVQVFLARGNLRVSVIRSTAGAHGAPAVEARSSVSAVLGASDALHLRHGVLSLQSRTLPAGRIHAIEVVQPLLWRPFGWWRLRMNVAGAAAAESGSAGATAELVSVGTAAQCVEVLRLLHPGMSALADPADNAGRGYTASPRRALLLFVASPWRHGYRVVEPGPTSELGAPAGEDGPDGPSAAWAGPVLALRRGMIWRSLALIPAARAQSISCQQGPVSRRLGLATISVHTVPGSARTNLRGLAAEDAQRAFAAWPRLVVRAMSRGQGGE
jgi:putative membrane protein